MNFDVDIILSRTVSARWAALINPFLQLSYNFDDLFFDHVQNVQVDGNTDSQGINIFGHVGGKALKAYTVVMPRIKNADWRVLKVSGPYRRWKRRSWIT